MGYTLTYFDIRGLAETARVLFHASGTEFKDNRISHEQWPALKATTPSGKLPFLDVDGHQLFESYAIYRFLANKFGLAGKDDFEKAFVDAIADYWRDTTNAGREYIAVALGRIQGDKDALYKEKFLPAIDIALPFLEKTLKKSGSGFVAPSGLTWVDIFIAENFLTLHGIAPDVFTKYPFTTEYQKRVHEHPKIKSYIESRKPSPV